MKEEAERRGHGRGGGRTKPRGAQLAPWELCGWVLCRHVAPDALRAARSDGTGEATAWQGPPGAYANI